MKCMSERAAQLKEIASKLRRIYLEEIEKIDLDKSDFNIFHQAFTSLFLGLMSEILEKNDDENKIDKQDFMINAVAAAITGGTIFPDFAEKYDE